VTERITETNGVELCSESFGVPTDPPILLIMGIGASMLWWEEGFCRLLAGGGRFVIRYDHRDTGRSSAYEPGRPGYTAADLVDDARLLLDAYGLPAAHLVGVSAGGGFAQLLALSDPNRILSLVLISTSPVTSGTRQLPPPSEEFRHFLAATPAPDWSDPGSVIDYQVAYSRLLAGGRRPFDEAGCRQLVRREVGRARDLRSAQNHELLAPDEADPGPLSSIRAPTLVIHGDADPMFPLAHGRNLAEQIPDARLLVLEQPGHGIDRADWQRLADEVIEHTAEPG
jgi:pimeloyl-ACP methyl ester carboxylesterase